MHPRLQDVPLEGRTPRPDKNTRQPHIQLSRNRGIELDRTANLKLADSWDEIQMVLYRIQRKFSVESGDPLEKAYRVEALTDIIDEFQEIALQGEITKKKEEK